VAALAVRGEAVLPVAPDYLGIRLTLTEVRQGADEAYDEVAKLSATLADLLTDLGIEASARSTSAVVVRAEREYDERGRPTHRGYGATSSMHVRLADPAVAASVIKQAVARTGAQIDGPWWEVAPENPARLEACRQAASLARSKAEAYAEALGVRLGALTEVAEPDPRVVPAGYRPVQAGFGPLYAGDEPEIPIAAGTLEVRAAVDVTFSIEPG
jgi:uncharacterized protein